VPGLTGHADSSPWSLLSELPVLVEDYAFERRSAEMAYGFQRVTTVVRLRGGGEEGLGEDVSPFEGEDDTLHVAQPKPDITGDWTLGSLVERIQAEDVWPVEPRYPMARRWRNWAFESAALDLALNQAGLPLHDAIRREPRPVRFVNSLGLGEPPTFDPIRRRLEHHPDLRFKLDATTLWTPELIEQVAATGAVEIIDFKGHYGQDLPELPTLVSTYERVIEAFPDALLEDGHDLPEITAVLEPHADRISYDAPIARVEDIDATPIPPRAVNIKPCRVGDLRSLFDVYAACAERGLITYGGGMGELAVGRGQIQLLASLFHPDAPNDTAPGGYNADTPAADLPSSPLPAAPAPTGFRRAA
jgi:hypothetical protein